METIHKIGRRKTSVARIYLKKGKTDEIFAANAAVKGVGVGF